MTRTQWLQQVTSNVWGSKGHGLNHLANDLFKCLIHTRPKCWLPPPPPFAKNLKIMSNKKKQRFPSWFEIHSANHLVDLDQILPMKLSKIAAKISRHNQRLLCFCLFFFILQGLLSFYDQRSLCLLCQHSGVVKIPFVFP